MQAVHDLEVPVGPRVRARTALTIVAAGAALGAFTVGVLSRAAMFLLIRLNPESDGVTSDDGFVMGQFTVSGSLNLVTAGVFIGALSGLVYLAVERLRFGPDWFRTVSLSAGAGVVVASQVVHTGGVDFTLLEPLALTVGLFVAVPVLHVAALDVIAVRIRTSRGEESPSATGIVAWVLRAALVVLVTAALASLVGDVRDLAG